MSWPAHILMTADTVGGVWTYAMELSQALRGHGVHLSIATMGRPLSAEQQQQAQRVGVDVYESRYKLEWMEEPWRDVDESCQWLLELESRLQPDLIHLNSYSHGQLAWNAPVVTVGHSCVFSWWSAVHGTEPPSDWAEYRRRVRNGLQASHKIVGVSRAMLRELQRWYGVGSGSIVYNGRRIESYQPMSKGELVLGSGRLWDAAKNVSALDNAAKLIRWPVYVAGEVQHPEGGRRELQHACPLGHLSAEDLRLWFGRAAIFASPALYEPFGLSVLEAALSGCALVLGDIPSFREIWGDAAVYVPPADDEALAACINALISRTARREALGQCARTRAMSFTMERMAQDYLTVYMQARAKFSGISRTGAVVGTSCAS